MMSCDTNSVSETWCIGITYSTWTDKMPADVPLASLTEVDAAQVADALEEAFSVMPEHMLTKRVSIDTRPAGVRGAPGSGSSAFGLVAHKDAVLSALSALQNPDLHWDEWNLKRQQVMMYHDIGGTAALRINSFSIEPQGKGD